MAVGMLLHKSEADAMVMPEAAAGTRAWWLPNGPGSEDEH